MTNLRTEHLLQIHTLYIDGQKVSSSSLRYLEELRAKAWAEGLEVSRITTKGNLRLNFEEAIS